MNSDSTAIIIMGASYAEFMMFLKGLMGFNLHFFSNQVELMAVNPGGLGL